MFGQLIREHGLPRSTDQTIVNSEQLRKEVARVAEQGFALDNEEAERGGRCIAAPIVNEGDDVVAAISITGPTSRIRIELVEEYAEVVKRIATRVGEALTTLTP